MQKKTIVFTLLLTIILASSGCIQFGEKNFSDLKAINEKYGLDGIIAPGTKKEIESFQKDLLSLKALAQQKKNRQSEALVAMIEYRNTVAEAELSLLNAIEEAKLIDYYDTSCSKETSIKKTIEYFEKAATKASLSIEMANNFLKNYSEFKEAAGIDIAKENNLLNNFKNTMLEKKKAYQQYCT